MLGREGKGRKNCCYTLLGIGERKTGRRNKVNETFEM